MNPSIGAPFSRLVLCLWVVFAAPAVTVGEPPDLELNPVTGSVEAVDVAQDGGNRVRHVVDKGQGADRTSELISSNAGAEPRIAINNSGASWVVWWRDGGTGEVIYRKRSPATGWSAETILSNAGEDSRQPEIVQCGSSIWIAFEVVSGGVTSIAATGISDTPEPFPTRTIIATTPFVGGRDVLVHSGAGQVWVTWVDGPTHVGWSRYDVASGLWSPAAYKPYGATGVDVARRNIRDLILGQ